MPDTYLSDVFRFIQKFGQKGHQIGRKIGDAIEVITLAVIYSDKDLQRYCVIEQGLEGASTAKHKVEFCFYELDALGTPQKEDIMKLFGFIECKKVGVEQTIKQSFKEWKDKTRNFSETAGYEFTIDPTDFKWRRRIHVYDDGKNAPALALKITDEKGRFEVVSFPVVENDTVLLTVDTLGVFHVLGPQHSLHDLEHSVTSCVVIHIEGVTNKAITRILVEDCLTGPQTPEKAKQASFVALDVRKRITGKFDRDDDDIVLSSALVIGESSHWEAKSRSMVRLCVDRNVIIPDEVVIRFFQVVLEVFGDGYQTHMRKMEYLNNAKLRNCADQIVKEFNGRILRWMDGVDYVRPTVELVNDRPALRWITVA
jgi:hypothetical protein